MTKADTKKAYILIQSLSTEEIAALLELAEGLLVRRKRIKFKEIEDYSNKPQVYYYGYLFDYNLYNRYVTGQGRGYLHGVICCRGIHTWINEWRKWKW